VCMCCTCLWYRARLLLHDHNREHVCVCGLRQHQLRPVPDVQPGGSAMPRYTRLLCVLVLRAGGWQRLPTSVRRSSLPDREVELGANGELSLTPGYSRTEEGEGGVSPTVTHTSRPVGR
jgi:hypothetical protein